MRRADALLAFVVAALGLFVVSQIVVRARSSVPRGRVVAAALPVRELHTVIVDSNSGSTDRLPTRTATALPVDVRARIAETPGTYMQDMIVDLRGQLIRWPDRRDRGLRIWVQSMSAVPDWDLRYAQMARNAFDDWGSERLPIRFDFVTDSATSDIQIVWSARFDADLGSRVGTTRPTIDQNGWLVAAQIEVAIHDSAGVTLPPGALVAIVRHEAGHALGMGHSPYPQTIMHPTLMVEEISAADRATMRLLYQLPAGRVR